jgi:DNA-binding CsgD family transcriptional regulator
LLSRSTRTIEGAIEHIKHKLDLYSKPQLVEYAIQTGLTRLIPQGLLKNEA